MQTISCSPTLPARSSRGYLKIHALFKTKKRAPGTRSLKKAKMAKLDGPTYLELPKEEGFRLGFTKSNELFVGRLAMLGFAASLIGEILTGKGALAQFGVEVGLPLEQVPIAVAGLAAFNLVAALLPTSGTFDPMELEELQKRPPGPAQDPSISLLQPRQFFGITRFGFSKANELFVGRVAQLGFAASLIGEFYTGQGPLAQLGFETGIPILDAEVGILVLIAFMLFASVNEGYGRFIDEDE